MTRTANKGATRAAATARRSRHAQRTPLPGDTSRPVKGNPTADTIKAMRAEEAKAKAPRKKSAASKARASETAAPAGGPGTRTFGDQTDSLAARVREMRDAGTLWKIIAKDLGLGEGKTGTSRARRLYRYSNGGKSAPRKTTQPRERKPRTVRVINDDGSSSVEEVHGDGGVPMQQHVPAFRLTARDKRRGKGSQRMCPINVFPLGERQVRNLTRIFEEQGYTVQAEKVGA